jgi:hypothetical protein
MCTVLGWVQGWWSVNGLAIEIAGFAVLSLDVAHEYGRHRTVERYRAGAAAAQRLVDAESSSDDSEPPVAAESSSADAERTCSRQGLSRSSRTERSHDRSWQCNVGVVSLASKGGSVRIMIHIRTIFLR